MTRTWPIPAGDAAGGLLSSVLASAALTASYTDSISDALDVSNCQWVDWQVAFATPGAPTLTAPSIIVQWSNVASPGSTDWVDLTREEFATTGSGVATESQYVATYTAPAVPGTIGTRTKARGNWMRIQVKATTATNVTRSVTAYRRGE